MAPTLTKTARALLRRCARAAARTTTVTGARERNAVVELMQRGRVDVVVALPALVIRARRGAEAPADE